MKYIIIVFISLLIFACNDNKSDEKITDNAENIEDSNDIFSNKEIVFGKLELGKNYTNENSGSHQRKRGCHRKSPKRN